MADTNPRIATDLAALIKENNAIHARLLAERDRLAAALADRDAQVTRVRDRILTAQGEPTDLAVSLDEAVEALIEQRDSARRARRACHERHMTAEADLRRALDGAGDKPRPQVWGDGCECGVTPESMHTTHYGATEPGSTIEYNPDCPMHGTPTEPTGDEPPTEPRDALHFDPPALHVYAPLETRADWGRPERPL